MAATRATSGSEEIMDEGIVIVMSAEREDTSDLMVGGDDYGFRTRIGEEFMWLVLSWQIIWRELMSAKFETFKLPYKNT